MFCPQCGAEYTDTDAFCFKCGAKNPYAEQQPPQQPWSEPPQPRQEVFKLYTEQDRGVFLAWNEKYGEIVGVVTYGFADYCTGLESSDPDTILSAARKYKDVLDLWITNPIMPMPEAGELWYEMMVAHSAMCQYTIDGITNKDADLVARGMEEMKRGGELRTAWEDSYKRFFAALPKQEKKGWFDYW